MLKTALSKPEWPIVGHSNIVNYLKHGLDSEQLAHAYLFVGPAHLGKTTLTKHFIDQLIDGADQSLDNAKLHPDIHWLVREENEKTGKLKKNISIEQVRQLQNKLSLHSFLGTYKIGVIGEAHTLSTEAANSLLKTLEEPTAKTVLILIADSIVNLPQTIVSRCSVVKFLPVSTQDIFDHLLSLKIERKKAKNLAAMSFGRPGVAINFTAEVDNYSDYLAEGRNFVHLLRSDVNERFKIIGDIVKTNDLDGIYQILNHWSAFFRDLMIINYLSPNALTHHSLASDFEKISANYDRQKMLNNFLKLKNTKIFLRANVNPRLALENLIINF